MSENSNFSVRTNKQENFFNDCVEYGSKEILKWTIITCALVNVHTVGTCSKTVALKTCEVVLIIYWIYEYRIQSRIRQKLMRSTSIAIFCGETALYVLRTLGVRHTVAATTPIVIQWKWPNNNNSDGRNWFALKLQKYFELVVKPLASVMFGYSSTGNHRLHQSVQILTHQQNTIHLVFSLTF